MIKPQSTIKHLTNLLLFRNSKNNLSLSSTTTTSAKRFLTPSSITAAMPGALNILEHVLNVNDRPLVQHSTNPVTGYFRTGFCETDASDHGRHLIAGILSEEFLDFSSRRGNDLRSAGLTGGCRWCLCVSRWKEAFDAFKSGQVERSVVPKVDLEATHKDAVGGRFGVKLEELREFSNR